MEKMKKIDWLIIIGLGFLIGISLGIMFMERNEPYSLFYQNTEGELHLAPFILLGSAVVLNCYLIWKR